MQELDSLRQHLLAELRKIGSKDSLGRCDLHDSVELIQSLNGLDQLCPHEAKETLPAGHADHLTAAQAKEWISSMHNVDGTTGPHWTYEQATQLMSQRSIDCNPIDFWAAVNMMHSDYALVARAYSTDTSSFYADMAAAFLQDKDAATGKLVKYWESIPKH